MAGRHSETLLNYCDKTDVENYLLLDIDNSFDSQIDSWIAAAESYVNEYLGYTTASGILKESITDEKAVSAFIDTEANLMIFPRKTPIVSVSSISLIKGTDSLDLSLTTSAGENKYNIPTTGDFIMYPDYELSITGASIISSFWDIRGVKFITKMSYIAGYTEVPYAVRQATVMVVSDYVMRHTNKEALESVTQGRVSKRWFQRRADAWAGVAGGESDFIKDAQDLLKPYRMTARWV